MNHVSELISRIIGPLLFAAAFSLTVVNSDVLEQYNSLVHSLISSDEVYNEGKTKVTNQIFVFDDEDNAYVSGSYIISMLTRDITVYTEIIDQTAVDNKFRLTFDTRLGTAVYYSVIDTTLINEVVKSTGVYTPGSYFSFGGYIDTNGQYRLDHTYGLSGELEKITFTRVS